MKPKRFFKKLFIKGNEIIRNVAENNSLTLALYKSLVLPINVVIFRANHYKVGTYIIPNYLVEINKTIEKYVSEDIRNNPQKLKEIEKDIVKAYFTGNFFPEEYFLYNFNQLEYKERREFISEQEKEILLCRHENVFIVETFKNKVKLYEIAKDFFHREVCVISEQEPKESFVSFVGRHNKFIAKPLKGLTGIGVTIIEIHDINEVSEIYSHLIQKDSWIVEELIIQHPEMAQWNPTSVNTLRVPVFPTAEGCRILQPFFRTGRKGSIVDNAGQGGVFAVFDPETGVITTDGVDENGGTYKYHPDSKLNFKGWQIPQYGNLKKIIAELIHLMPFDFKYVGFDFALTPEGWVLVEGNSHGQFVGQIAEQKGVRKKVLQYLENGEK